MLPGSSAAGRKPRRRCIWQAGLAQPRRSPSARCGVRPRPSAAPPRPARSPAAASRRGQLGARQAGSGQSRARRSRAGQQSGRDAASAERPPRRPLRARAARTGGRHSRRWPPSGAAGRTVRLCRSRLMRVTIAHGRGQRPGGSRAAEPSRDAGRARCPGQARPSPDGDAIVTRGAGRQAGRELVRSGCRVAAAKATSIRRGSGSPADGAHRSPARLHQPADLLAAGTRGPAPRPAGARTCVDDARRAGPGLIGTR